jgi:prevent-host-death family protein
MSKSISVAETKRRFSELLARTAYAGERFIVARRGTPMAALVGVADLNRLEGDGDARRPGEPEGLLAAAGTLADYERFEQVMADVYRARRRSKGRSVRLR